MCESKLWYSIILRYIPVILSYPMYTLCITVGMYLTSFVLGPNSWT
jgi:hypothetical protein